MVEAAVAYARENQMKINATCPFAIKCCRQKITTISGSFNKPNKIWQNPAELNFVQK